MDFPNACFAQMTANPGAYAITATPPLTMAPGIGAPRSLAPYYYSDDRMHRKHNLRQPRRLHPTHKVALHHSFRDGWDRQVRLRHRSPCPYSSLIRYTGNKNIVQSIQDLPFDIGDMISKCQLTRELTSMKGYDLITKKVCSWMRGPASWEDWRGHRFHQTLVIPRNLVGGKTRSSSDIHFVSLTLNSSDEYGPFWTTFLVPVWWCQLWFRGRNQCVIFANSGGNGNRNENWFDLFRQCCPTLGNFIVGAYHYNTLLGQQLFRFADGTDWDLHHHMTTEPGGWFGCRGIVNRLSRGSAPDGDEFMSGFDYKGPLPHIHKCCDGRGLPNHLSEDDGYTHIARPKDNTGTWMNAMKFCEDTLWYGR